METTVKLKKITATIIAIVFCAVCCLLPINRYKQAKAAEIGTLMLASSVLLSLYMIGIHTDSSGVTNFEHVANAIQDQYRKDFVYENYQNMVTGEPETRVGQLYNMWQEGVIDISSNAWASFKQWAFDRAMGVFESNSDFNGASNGFSYYFNNDLLTTSNFNIITTNGYNVTPSYSYNSSVAPYLFFNISDYYNYFGKEMYMVMDSSNNLYFVYPKNITYSLFLRLYQNESFNSGDYYTRNYYQTYTYYNIQGQYKTFITNNYEFTDRMSVTNFIDGLIAGSIDYNTPSPAEFELSLDQNTVYNQVKAVADREIGQATTQDLLDKAKYLNDAIGQHTKDGSNLVNLRDGTIPFQGDADATADAILSGDISVPEIQQSLGIDTTVQGQVITDTATPTYEIATPSDIATSVPLVVNPSLTVIEPQEYTYPDRYGGDFSFPLSNYFPFCLPFDAVRIFKMVNGSPQAPQISFNANSIFGGYFKNYNHGSDGDLVKIRGDTVTLDLAAFNTVAMICRVMMYLLFLVGVCFGIRNWIHGGD